MPATTLRLGMAGLLLAATGCHREQPQPGRLPERGYLWQRDWTPAVAQGFLEAEKRMDGVVVLGAEIGCNGGKPLTVRADIEWDQLRGKNVALALRVDPWGGPFAGNDTTVGAILAEARRLLGEARAHAVRPTEIQLDFDCAQRNLAGYGAWVRALRGTVAPVPLIITALPSWLAEEDFPVLAGAADGYVLQVHSVPTLPDSGRAVLCDPALARKWVAQASGLGIPFSVSLPAYWCVAGYDARGRLLGVAMDSVQPAWPPGTSMLEFAADADEIAGLVSEWKQARPPGMKGLLWYRVPVATDRRNWHWPTLAAVMSGRKPAHRLAVSCDGDNPVDVSVENEGEAEERGPCTVTLTWSGAASAEWDALPGWTLSVEPKRAIFATLPGSGLRLSPGERKSIGWIRYDEVTKPRCEVGQYQGRDDRRR